MSVAKFPIILAFSIKYTKLPMALSIKYCSNDIGRPAITLIYSGLCSVHWVEKKEIGV